MEMRMRVFRSFVFLCLILLFSIPSLLGSGFVFDGLGAKARGLGGAFRAIADDWSAAYYNPAGLNQIPDNIITANLATFHNRYWINPNVTWGGRFETGYQNGYNHANHHAILNVPQGGIIARLPIFGETVMGFTIMQLFDQNQSWELYENIPAHNDSSIAVFPTDQFGINLDGVAFQLTAARGFMEDRLSVGLGFSVVRGDLVYSSVVLRDNPMPSPVSDRPHDKIPEWYRNNGNGWGFGYRLGVLYDITDRIKFGVTYAGKTSIDVTGTSLLEFYMGLNPSNNYYVTNQLFEEYLFLNGEVIEYTADFETSLDLPATIGGGLAVEVNDKLTVALDAEMIFWSQFKGLDFAFSNYYGTSHRNQLILSTDVYPNAKDLVETDLSAPIVWKDVPRVMAGAIYKAYSFAEVRAGFSADRSPVKWENPIGITQIPQFIDLGTKFSYSFGVGFDIDVWTLEFANTYTHHPDLRVSYQLDEDNDGQLDNLTADYEADNYQFVMGISYRF
jgi:long-chain fatty acid transport protein